MNTADLSLIELQKVSLANPENEELKATFMAMVKDWLHLEDCFMEETEPPD